MSHWGILAWVGFLILALVLLIYYQGAAKLTTSFGSAFGTTVEALTGRPGGLQATYAASN